MKSYDELREGGLFRSLQTLLPNSSVVTLLMTIAALLFTPGLRAQSTQPQIVAVGNTGFNLVYVFQLNPSSGALVQLPSSPVTLDVAAEVFTVNPAGTYLFVAINAPSDAGGYTAVSVFAINQTTGALTEVPNSPFATGFGEDPQFITTDPTGKFLYVANGTWILNGAPSYSSGEIDAYSISSSGQLTPTPNSTMSISVNQGPSPTVSGWAHPNGRWLYLAGNEPSGYPYVINSYSIDQTTGDLSNTGSNQALSNVINMAGNPNGSSLVEQYGGACGILVVLNISQIDGTIGGGLLGPWASSASNICSHSDFLAFDPSGDFIYTGWGIFNVTDGSFTPPANPAIGALTGPYVADPAGPFVLTPSNGVTINTVNPSTGALTPISSVLIGSGFSLVAISGSPQATPAPVALFSPGDLAFQNDGIGAPVPPQTITFANTGTASMNISSIAITGANAADFSQTNTCTSSTLAAGANCSFTVTFTPSTTAAETAAVTITDNAAGSPQSAGLTSFAYVVPPPMPSLNPSSLSFASTAVGATSSLTFSIMNSGGQALTVSGITFTGTNPSDFTQSSSCASVAASASCVVSVTFQPQAQGLRTASAVVTFANVTPATQSVALSGTGTAPSTPFTVAPSGPISSTVQPGQAASYGMNFTPTAGFAGTAMVNCAVSPAGPTCSVSPATIQVTASNSPTTTPVTITASTPAATRKMSSLVALPFLPGTQPSVAAIGAVAFGIFGLLPLVGLRRMMWRGFVVRIAASALIVLSIGVMAACGGGNGGSTTPQTYTVNVTTTAGASTQIVTYTLTVQ
jgi:hypothetical protein